MTASDPDAIDSGFRPRLQTGWVCVPVAGGGVLLDGWERAIALGPIGVGVWSRFDGRTSIGDVARALSAERGDRDVDALVDEVLGLVRLLAAAGLVENARPPGPEHHILATAVPQPEVGDVVADVEALDLHGVSGTLADDCSGSTLLVNWNPNCGYCASIAMDLAGLEPSLGDAGIGLVFLAAGDAGSNRGLADRSGITSPVLLLGEAESPFGAAGTPAAFHLDADRRITEIAYGNIEVPRLARSLAGVGQGSDGEGASGVLYLLERDGLCAAGTGTNDGPVWVETVTYAIGDHHVGIRVDSEATAGVLDRLFRHRRVDDPRAGHSYSVALPSLLGADTAGAVTGLNLLVQPGRATVRSRDPGRVLRALLADLHDRIHDRASSGTCRRVNAVAVGVTGADGGPAAGLIPQAFHSFAPRLQSLLAARGVALCDTPHPELDLATGELVVPEPDVDHDPAVIDDVSIDLTGTRGELGPLLPGRYPFHGWCVVHPGEHDLVEFSVAESAAATISFLTDATDPVVAVQEMAELFQPVAAYGLWYHSVPEVADLVARTLTD